MAFDPNRQRFDGIVDVATSTSPSLLARVRSQEHAAWERLVRLYGPLVYRWCRDLRVAPQDAADVVQEVFMVVFQRLDTFQRDREGYGFRKWLRTVTKRKVIDRYRRVRNQPLAQGGSVVADKLAQIAADDEGEECIADETAELFQRVAELTRPMFKERTWQAFWGTTIEGRSPLELCSSWA